ncbi:hypothetical protein AB0451_38865 [Streptomyces sp. NPDC052000]|uniref:hypothetical protein n=1 Tax=Streptomyces sp. NPDC052000 TaxID=3155676 RepID=UPI00344F5949
METIHFDGGPLIGRALPEPVPAPWKGGWYRFEASDQWTLYVPAYRVGSEVLAQPRVQTRA